MPPRRVPGISHRASDNAPFNHALRENTINSGRGLSPIGPGRKKSDKSRLRARLFNAHPLETRRNGPAGQAVAFGQFGANARPGGVGGSAFN